MKRYEAIQAYIASSEFNRLKKHGICILSQQVFNVHGLLDLNTIDNKLKRKLRMCLNIGLITPTY